MNILCRAESLPKVENLIFENRVRRVASVASLEAQYELGLMRLIAFDYNRLTYSKCKGIAPAIISLSWQIDSVLSSN